MTAIGSCRSRATHLGRWLAFPILCALGWLAFGADSMQHRAAEQRCHELIAAVAPDTRVELRAASRLTSRGALAPGPRTSCSGPDAPLFVTGLEAYRRVPQRWRVPLLSIDAMAPGSGAARLEFDPDSGSILASDAALPEVAWLHEIAHVLARGPRPRSLIPGRLYAALDEAVADYFAAVMSRSPELGPSGRHLDRPPSVRDGEWALLGVRRAPFDAHRFGWALSSALWREEPDGGPLLDSLLTCLRGESVGVAADSSRTAPDTPLAFVRLVGQRCPTRERARIDRLLRQWLRSVLVATDT